MKETPRRRITATSSLNKILKISCKIEQRGGDGGVTPPPLVQQDFGQIFKDDVNSFFSSSDDVFAS